MNKNIKHIVDYYVKKCGSRNPFDIADYLNIQIQIGQLGTPCGCYMFLKNHRCIFLNENLSENEMNLVMSHELGHAVMHSKLNCYFIRSKTLLLDSKIETEANTFAINLLIPDETIIEIIDNRNCTLEYMSRMLGYNQKLIELRLKHLRKNNYCNRIRFSIWKIVQKLFV